MGFITSRFSYPDAVSQFNDCAKGKGTFYSMNLNKLKQSSTNNTAGHIPQSTRDGVKCVNTEENETEKFYKPGILTDKVSPAIDFTDVPLVWCECAIPVVKNTSLNDGDIQMITNKFCVESGA